MKKPWIWIIAIVFLFVAVRLALPNVIRDYVNKTLNDLNGYTGSVNDIEALSKRVEEIIDFSKQAE